MPIFVERANLQKPHAEYVKTQTDRLHSHASYGHVVFTHPQEHLLFATILTKIEIYQIPMSQERALVYAFFNYVCNPPLEPRPGFCCAVCGCKVKNNSLYIQKLLRKC